LTDAHDASHVRQGEDAGSKNGAACQGLVTHAIRHETPPTRATRKSAILTL
jgi:hypothetical protein